MAHFIAKRKIITIILSDGNRRFPIPNLVMKTIMMIKKVYGLKICVFVTPLCGATSGLLFSAVLSLFLPVLSISALCVHSVTIKKMNRMAMKVDRPEICVFMAP